MKRLTQWDVAASARLTLLKQDARWPLAAKLAHLGDGTLIFGGLAVIYTLGWLFNRPSLRLGVWVTLVSLFVSALVVMGIKYTLRRERPNDPTGFVTIRYDKYSFPSGHSARMGTLAGSVMVFSLPLGLGLAVLAIVIAAARVVIGVHYLSDILVGLSLGFTIGLITGLLFT